MSVQYRLKRDMVPWLILEVPEQQPELVPQCLREKFPRLPVPRELFFQTYEEGQLQCYSSRVDLEKDEVLWTKVPFWGRLVKISFPIDPLPKTDEESVLLLLSWVLTPFWHEGEGKRYFQSWIMTDTVCERCFGDKDLLRPSDPPGRLWP